MQSLGAPAIRCLVEALQATPLYREYQQAFRRATGMSMMLRLPDTDEMLSAAGRAEQIAFCIVMTGSEFNCGGCLGRRWRTGVSYRRAFDQAGSNSCRKSRLI